MGAAAESSVNDNVDGNVIITHRARAKSSILSLVSQNENEDLHHSNFIIPKKAKNRKKKKIRFNMKYGSIINIC